MKDALIDTAVLRVADPTKPYILQTDASERGLGAVLSQVDAQGEEHPVAFTSRKLLLREMNYSTIEKECLAIVMGIEILQHISVRSSIHHRN